MLGACFYVWAFSKSETETETDSNLRLSVVYRSRPTYVCWGLWLTCNGTCFYTRLSLSLSRCLSLSLSHSRSVIPPSHSSSLTVANLFIIWRVCCVCVCAWVSLCVCVGKCIWNTCLAITSLELSKRKRICPWDQRLNKQLQIYKKQKNNNI